MGVDFESLSDVLKHPVRRKIILTLFERGNLSYVDLMNFVGVSNTGKFNYHLKILGDLIEKDQNGRYFLTEKGHMAAQLLQKFPEKKPQPTFLPMADAAVIGFAGVVLTVINPVFWISAFIALLRLELDVPFFFIIGFSSLAYTLMVPGAVMWLLTVRRTNSHDMYDLMKPPLITFILLLVLLTIMLLLNVNLVITIKSPTIQGPQGQTNGAYWSTEQHSIMQTSLQTLLFQGLILSFLGVLIAELTSRLRKRITR
ncbi:MAG: winged helix-turn-helix domain-containing protein [Candidatus Bathyarchaeia archaeon]